MTTEDKIKGAGEYFGYKELKPFQSNVVKSVCNGQDVFLMSPTGSGKSLTYEMVPFVFERLGKKDKASVIIVSPLVALIEAQCEKLRSKGLSASQFSKDSKTTELGKCQYIFASPEMLLEVRRETLLSSDIQQNVVAVFVDEGHCIINWYVICVGTLKILSMPI